MRSRAGFTLVEALVSFAIVTMVLVVLLPRMGEAARRSASGNLEWRAVEEIVSELVLIDAGLMQPERVLGNGWSIRSRIDPADASDGAALPDGLVRITVTALLDERIILEWTTLRLEGRFR